MKFLTSNDFENLVELFARRNGKTSALIEKLVEVSSLEAHRFLVIVYSRQTINQVMSQFEVALVSLVGATGQRRQYRRTPTSLALENLTEFIFMSIDEIFEARSRLRSLRVDDYFIDVPLDYLFNRNSSTGLETVVGDLKVAKNFFEVFRSE